MSDPIDEHVWKAMLFQSRDKDHRDTSNQDCAILYAANEIESLRQQVTALTEELSASPWIDFDAHEPQSNGLYLVMYEQYMIPRLLNWSGKPENAWWKYVKCWMPIPITSTEDES